MKRMQPFLVLLCLAIVCGLVAVIASAHVTPKPATLVTRCREGGGSCNSRLLVAQTTKQIQKGLGDRPALEGADGMLFIFPNQGKHSIWMKDMHFAIDIYWLDENFTIVDQKRDVHPDTYPTTFVPKQPAAYVLEMVAGRPVTDPDQTNSQTLSIHLAQK